MLYNLTIERDTEENKMTIIKVDKNGKETNYGSGYTDPYEIIPKNYKFNGLFYEAQNTKTIYIVEK